MRPDTLIEVNAIDQYDDNQLLFATTGSQGEPMSALTRMAFSEHRQVKIKDGDTVIISATMIPGNEKSIYRVINELVKRGANVIYESIEDVHVSGHAYQNELQLMISLTKPKYFIPAHGEYRHLHEHAKLAHGMGIPEENIFILNNGDMLELDEEKAEVVGFVDAAGVLIDGSGMGDVDQHVLRDRRLLADDGVVAVVVAVDPEKNQIVGQPSIQARGFIYESEIERTIQGCTAKILSVAERSRNRGQPLVKVLNSRQLTDPLRNLLFERTKRRPMILVTVLEV